MKCEHLSFATLPEGTEVQYRCEECIQLGDRWVHLRVCLTCGHVGCCDSSKNKHASKHFATTRELDGTGHPIVQSIEPGENWRWCFIDEAVV